jgi:DNA-binding response OmpR family regulator
MEKKEKILFIEDEADIVMMMRMRLEASGYDMIEAYDGEEGFKMAESEKPDLILLDI